MTVFVLFGSSLNGVCKTSFVTVITVGDFLEMIAPVVVRRVCAKNVPSAILALRTSVGDVIGAKNFTSYSREAGIGAVCKPSGWPSSGKSDPSCCYASI